MKQRVRDVSRGRVRLCVATFGLAALLFSSAWAATLPNVSELHREFAIANEDYQNRRFKESLDRYLHLISLGVRDPVLYYNAGNAYVQLGQRGRAAAMYERALRLAPREARTQKNLRYVLPSAGGPAAFILWRPFLFVRDLFSLNEWLVIGDVLVFWIAIAWSLALLWRAGLARTIVRWFLIVGVALAVAVAGFAPWRGYAERGRRIAVVVQDKAVSRHGPSMTLGEHLSLAEGTRVEILSSEGNGWLCIRPYDVPGASHERTYIRQEAVEPV